MEPMDKVRIESLYSRESARTAPVILGGAGAQRRFIDICRLDKEVSKIELHSSIDEYSFEYIDKGLIGDHYVTEFVFNKTPDGPRIQEVLGLM